MPDTSARVWFITGTGTGLGNALVDTALKNGEKVVATTRNPQSLADLTAIYGKEQLLVQKLDLNNAQDIKAAFAAAISAFGRVDVVVNNAGYAIFGEVESIPEEEARKLFDIQFWGAVNITKEAVRVFREVNPNGDGGRFFNVSSIGGYMANPTLAYYSAAKFALEGFTEAIIKEMSPEWNIKGSIIEPGGFASEWAGASAQMLPPHPAYTAETNPCAIFRKIHESTDFPFLGDARKMAVALYKLAGEPELPLRVPFGSEALFLVTSQAQKTISEGDKFAYISRSTDRDDMDGEKYIHEVLLKSGNFERNK